MGTDLGFELTLWDEAATRAGLARTGSGPWDGRRATRILWSCRELSQGARALAWARVCVSACVHLCACVCTRVCACREGGRHTQHPRDTAQPWWPPLHLLLPQARAGAAPPQSGRPSPASGARRRAREVGLGGGRAEGGQAGGRRIREARQLFDRSQGSRRGRGGPPGAGRAAG